MSTNLNLGIDLLTGDDNDLVIGNDGDLALTANGIQTLLQDIAHFLVSLPGDLYGHVDYGAGVINLVGENDIRMEQRIKRAVEDGLYFGEPFVGRIVQGSINVGTVTVDLVNIEVEISLQAIDDDLISDLNLVWKFGLEDMSSLVDLIEEAT